MKLLNYSFYIFTLIIFIGCKKPIPDPHLNDYIYLNLKQELTTTESKLTDVKKEFSDYVSKSKDPSLSISDIKVARAKADFALKEIRKLEQKVKYWKLKLLSREELVRISYLSAFNKGEEWNNDDEVIRFKKAKEWGKDRKPAKISDKKIEKKSTVEDEENIGENKVEVHETEPEKSESE